ncbi:MAG: hypothetical protein EP330_28975 [Deltaproteobacteria bacterium]|nr:MAG: hypothetical protein EP330_28975 [Deltaproteobacteria bacterium]
MLLPMLAILCALAAEPEAPPAPYETRELQLQLKVRGEQDMRDWLAEKLRARRLKLVKPGPEGPERIKLRDLPLEAVAAGLHAVFFELRDVENDAMMQLSDDGPMLPVSVIWRGRELLVTVGEPWQAPDPGDLTPDVMRERYGVGELREAGSTWNPRSLQLLDLALSRLRDEELAVMRILAFDRKPAAKPEYEERLGTAQQGRLAAIYAQEEGEGRIEVYDGAFGAYTHFVGEPEDPQPMSLMILLHELGHAVSEQLEIELFQAMRDLAEVHNDRGEKLEKRVVDRDGRARRLDGKTLAEIDAELDRESEVIAGMRAMLDRLSERRERGSAVASAFAAVDGVRPPTWYAATSEAELFAESFALYHADRAALERASPAAVAWFDAGEHRALLREDLTLLAEARALLD